MARSLSEIITELDALTAAAFDLDRVEARGLERLNVLTDELRNAAPPEDTAGILFGFMERVTAAELRPPRYDFGSPGPLVHTLEKLPGYEHHLVKSLRRQPTPLGVWMLNRLINGSDASQRGRLLTLRQELPEHPRASAYTREEARFFGDYQSRQVSLE